MISSYTKIPSWSSARDGIEIQRLEKLTCDNADLSGLGDGSKLIVGRERYDVVGARLQPAEGEAEIGSCRRRTRNFRLLTYRYRVVAARYNTSF